VQLVYPQGRLVAPKVRAFVDFAAPRLRTGIGELSLKPPKIDKRPVASAKALAAQIGQPIPDFDIKGFTDDL
jgi:hypothetical protein